MAQSPEETNRENDNKGKCCKPEGIRLSLACFYGCVRLSAGSTVCGHEVRKRHIDNFGGKNKADDWMR